MPVKMPLKLAAHPEQHQPAQGIYTTEVKRLSPVGNVKNLHRWRPGDDAKPKPESKP
jgi:hypothetical protein